MMQLCDQVLFLNSCIMPLFAYQRRASCMYVHVRTRVQLPTSNGGVHEDTTWLLDLLAAIVRGYQNNIHKLEYKICNHRPVCVADSVDITTAVGG